MSGWSANSEPVEAVLFDLGNTLVSYYRSADFPPVLRRCVAAAAEALPGHPTAAQLDAAFARALACNVERADGRVWPLAERLIRVFELEADTPAALLERLAQRFLEPVFATAKIDPDALSILKIIRELGIKSAIVSNTPWGSAAAAWRKELARLGLTGAVDAAVFCTDVGWRKPASPAFERALTLLGVRAERAWFVGDDRRWDVEGATRAGLRPILLSGEASDTGVTRIAKLTDLLPLLESAS
jgi:putative hydrolase of the HAD superfamily